MAVGHKHGVCGRCERALQRGDSGASSPLCEPDFCHMCCRPLTERGERLADQAGFLAFVRAVMGRQPAQSRTQGGNVKLVSV